MSELRATTQNVDRSSAPADHVHNPDERTTAHRQLSASTRATSPGPVDTNDLVGGA